MVLFKEGLSGRKSEFSQIFQRPDASRESKQPSHSQTPNQGGLFRRSQHRRNYLTDKPSPMPYCLRGKGNCNLPPYYLLPFLRIHIILSMFSTLTSMISHPGWQDSKFCGALFFITEEYIRAESNEPSVSSSNSFWMLLLMSLVTYPCLSFYDTKSSFSLFFPHSLNIWNKFKNKYYISQIRPAFSNKSNTLLKDLLLERRSRSNCINQESAKI